MSKPIKSKNLNLPRLAIIRALDLRIIQAEYASFFVKLKPSFISNYSREIDSFLKKRKTRYIYLKLKPSHLLEPVSFFKGQISHQSPMDFEDKSLLAVLARHDVLQIQEPFFLYSGQVAKMAEKLDKPLIITPFTSFNHPSSFIPPYSTSVKNSVSRSDLFILRTKKVEDYLGRFKIPDSKKVLIYHGVNLKRFYPRQKTDTGVVKILFVGQMNESKGLDDLLAIFPKLIKEVRTKPELIICGRGGLERKVEALAEKYPIKYLGNVSNLNLPKIYRLADIFCGPSKTVYSFGIKRWEENFGFVFAESMASGLPIVTTDCGAIKEVVGEGNFVNKERDQKALFLSLFQLIQDSKLRRKMGLANRFRSEKLFDMRRQIEKEEQETVRRFC